MARKDHPDAHTRLVISRIISLTTGPELVPSIAWEDQTVKQPVSVYRPLYCRFALQIYMEWIKWQQVRIYTLGGVCLSKLVRCKEFICSSMQSFRFSSVSNIFYLDCIKITREFIVTVFHFPTLPSLPCCNRKTKRICHIDSLHLSPAGPFSPSPVLLIKKK